MKKCKYCKKNIPIIHKNYNKKNFCDITCQQNWWKEKRNISGKTRTSTLILRKNLPHLTEKQKQLCYGGLLGDSSINVKPNGNCRIQTSHCKKQLEYLKYKNKLILPFTTEVITEDKNISSFGGETSYHASTIVHQVFTDMYGLFYRKEKGIKRRYINRKILNAISEFAILIWFLDDGYYKYDIIKKCHILRIYSCCYSLSEHKVLKKWFMQRWGIEAIINFDKTHNKYSFRFNKTGIVLFYKKFLEPFINEIPECMNYKIPKFSLEYINSALPADYVK